MCGKYNGAPLDESSKITALWTIANELAEANRLKRIELEQQYTGLRVEDEAT